MWAVASGDGDEKWSEKEVAIAIVRRRVKNSYSGPSPDGKLPQRQGSNFALLWTRGFYGRPGWGLLGVIWNSHESSWEECDRRPNRFHHYDDRPKQDSWARSPAVVR